MGCPIIVRRSRIHGHGVFAARDLPERTELIEYTGRLITFTEADLSYDEIYKGHTFLFTLNDAWIIDGNVGGNDARWFNHGCEPNCIPYLHAHPRDRRKDRVIIETLRDVDEGEELSYDYGISFDVPYSARLKRIWACRCGAASCSGTLLKPMSHIRQPEPC
ncbi:MAG: SET domain-containing protein-lysine N-methyltransferase [Flavobacteriales bacterium]|jgi:SET domain-containing protein|nr:SET domain-containing protein-lysine N-methyltransferase [Flavobacteriales bacterium]MBK9598142.1 SET domain-containing protein-lysine N-methyltransferase [Flavobacteriales bacterium]